MRKLFAAVAGFLVSLCTSTSAQAQKAAAVPTLSAPGMVVFGAVLGVAALLVNRRKR